ncbi:unnamed protein product [Lasius platythorax]|uniref:Uncharacterized protein n=1 Tax=Lasius platythorax TaxID=488582 RepID=A0AAV2NEH6_9HYME
MACGGRGPGTRALYEATVTNGPGYKVDGVNVPGKLSPFENSRRFRTCRNDSGVKIEENEWIVRGSVTPSEPRDFPADQPR